MQCKLVVRDGVAMAMAMAMTVAMENTYNHSDSDESEKCENDLHRGRHGNGIKSKCQQVNLKLPSS